MDPRLLLLVGGLGLVGCLILLVMGFNMLREERASKEGAAAPEAGGSAPSPAAPRPAIAASPAEPEPLYAAPPTAAPGPGPGSMRLGEGMTRLMAGVMARVPARAGSAAKGSAHEVLRVLRDNLTGRILIELGGQRYTNLGDVREPELRQALQTILEDLDLLRGGLTAEPPSLLPPAGQLELAPPEQPANLPARPPASTPSRPAGGERTLPRPTMNPFKQMAVLREMSKNPPPPELTIAEQIEVVLQAHIQGTPLVERGLHMRPGPRGDAVFELDGESYTAVEALPDEAVRAVVRGAIAEWEARQ